MPNTTDTKSIIIRNIPEKVRQELKSKSALEGKTMQAVILGLITGYINKKATK